MAVWQFTVVLIPSIWAERNNYEVGELLSEDGFITEPTWRNHQPSIDVDELFSLILPRVESWTDRQSLWGNDKVHDISVWRKDGRVNSIRYRFDLREDVTTLMSDLCEAAIKLGCVLFIPAQKAIIEPSVTDLKKYSLSSNAARFVEDPEAFLGDLSS